MSDTPLSLDAQIVAAERDLDAAETDQSRRDAAEKVGRLNAVKLAAVITERNKQAVSSSVFGQLGQLPTS